MGARKGFTLKLFLNYAGMQMGGSGANVDVFRAVADPTRREILDRLSADDLTVTELAAGFAMSLPAVSQHLKLLREAGLVRERRRGRRRIYSLVAGPLREVADWVSHYDEFWRGKLRDLGKHLEESERKE